MIYFDSPYDYELVRLRNVCDALIECGCIVFLSNNDTKFVRECFSGKNYAIHLIEAMRMINCKSDGRKLIDEVVISGRKSKLQK